MLFVPVPSGFSRTEFKCPYIIIYTYYIYLIYLYFYFLTFSSVILWWLCSLGHFVSKFTPPIIFFLHRIGQNMYWSILFSFYHKCIGGKTMWVSVSCVNLWISLVTICEHLYWISVPFNSACNWLDVSGTFSVEKWCVLCQCFIQHPICIHNSEICWFTPSHLKVHL